ncbi:DUF58 domain-containing protein [Coraliomargarita sp. SDUM461004]|uniref:DUF58 domain-containing protein n=1 Tax=Thalassobacterium sedimentorum TaxID=3041258 RepID=A0ABU1AEY3_9BACT|nr:DUF58 domain-containing protein [Coraliomargarita sp. SDUM461004]MDQ8193367.1 DUF58 domain-containing protein [Coraliomargarita sp. SDUM461004]
MRRWHDWTDPDFFMEGRQHERRLIPLFLRQILPRRMQQTKLTLTGWMLVIVALGIGSAAYNTSSNILFMTLSMLLSSLVLSGILSVVNFRKLSWALQAPQHLQVGEVGMAEIVLKNEKGMFPTMSMAFRVSSRDGMHLLYLKHAISAGDIASLEWTFVPVQRGRLSVYLHGVESKFPFGFLSKGIEDTAEAAVWVWPERIEYSFLPLAHGRRYQTGVARHQAGVGNDLLNVRTYEMGDSPRLIHWKATARMNKLMVRQLAQEGESGFHLWLDPIEQLWNGAQIETLCSAACALAEDLFHVGRLESACVGQEPWIRIRGLRELHDFFDQLARLEPVSGAGTPPGEHSVGRRNMITFRPYGERGVSIYVNGTQAGQA